jgi:DNA-binding response OmpR family regulator
MILILESDVAAWRFIRLTLREAGFETVEGATVVEARGVIARTPRSVRLAIINVSIPGGFDLASELAASTQHVKILYTSSVLHCVILDSVARLTPDAVIQKPVVAEELLEQVRRLLAAEQTRSASA